MELLVIIAVSILFVIGLICFLEKFVIDDDESEVELLKKEIGLLKKEIGRNNERIELLEYKIKRSNELFSLIISCQAMTAPKGR